jgi:hypothetical protein
VKPESHTVLSTFLHPVTPPLSGIITSVLLLPPPSTWPKAICTCWSSLDMSSYADAFVRCLPPVKKSLVAVVTRLHVHRFVHNLRACWTCGGRNGSITQLPILTMPNDDITHPSPILLDTLRRARSTTAHTKGIFPPITCFRVASNEVRYRRRYDLR